MTTTTDLALDEHRMEAFAERLASIYVDAMTTMMIHVGHATGLFEAAAQAPATSEELARRAGLSERYVREWLGALTTAGIVDLDPGTGRYTLPMTTATSSPSSKRTLTRSRSCCTSKWPVSGSPRRTSS